MVWTDVSGLLTVVALIVLATALLAILYQETRSKSLPAWFHQDRLPDDVNLSDAERQSAMRGFSGHWDRKPTTGDR